jgi:hypothetical protein
VRINLTPGILGKFGYASNLLALKRRQALAKAIVARGKEKAIDRRAAALSIFRRLNVLVLYRKNAPRSKAKSAFEADKAWVKKTYLSPPRMKKRATAKAPAKRGNGQLFGRKSKPTEPSQWQIQLANKIRRAKEQENERKQQQLVNQRAQEARSKERQDANREAIAAAYANQQDTTSGRGRPPKGSWW